ncbi:hypothetical protein Agub_g13672 [Astrephomene gubernaculifera]|uniref:GIY-YIG domain-containing protein n=1 Tax=Astrephomene gubernaculifera TaxID=47775 RepID=A0AAD3E2U2_9CHLO|nr:hypothetical protein Agub_g13672 [Astrephomene gubernaculifera]
MGKCKGKKQDDTCCTNNAQSGLDNRDRHQGQAASTSTSNGGGEKTCKGEKKDGERCTYKAQPDSDYCRVHQQGQEASTSNGGGEKTCKGEKKDGERCTYKAQPDSDYCRVHQQGQEASTSNGGGEKTCKGEKKDGERCTYKAQPDSDYCRVHQQGQEASTSNGGGEKTCKGKKKDDERCTYKAQPDSDYCRVHQQGQEASTSNGGGEKTCKGKKKDGERCTYKAQPGSDYCRVHQQGQEASTSNGGGEKTCKGEKKDGERCTYKAQPDSDYCRVHQQGQATVDEGIAAGAKPNSRLPTVVNGRICAETLAGNLEDIAKDYGVGTGNALLVVVMGEMVDDPSELRAQVPKGPGNYIWTIRAPRAKNWVPVYCGKANSLTDRFTSYINMDGTFGPRSELAKYWPMVDAMSRGFSIEIRFRPTRLGDAMKSEADTLDRYDFPLNTVNNNKAREIMLTGGKRMSDYDIKHPKLAELGQNARGVVAYGA